MPPTYFINIATRTLYTTPSKDPSEMNTTYNDSAVSISDEHLAKIFSSHPHSTISPDGGQVVLPARFLPDVFKSLSEIGLTVLNASEEEELHGLVSMLDGPGRDELMVSGDMLIGLLAQLRKSRLVEAREIEERGRKNHNLQPQSSRSSATGSLDDLTNTSQNPSSPTSRSIPHTPKTPRFASSSQAGASSPLDSAKRQRSAPISANPPSSFAFARCPPPPRHRRKSDASPSGRADSSGRRRSRAGSNSDSQGAQQPMNILSPTSAHVLPLPSGSAGKEDSTISLSSSSSSSSTAYSPHSPLSSPELCSPFPTPTKSIYSHTQLAYDSDDPSSSTTSLIYSDRLDTLTRTNQNLVSRLEDAGKAQERTVKLHELELAALQSDLDAVCAELRAMKRDELQLRGTGKSNDLRIAALESEAGKLEGKLEEANTLYTQLHKDYTNQCALSEEYRLDLRAREESIRTLTESVDFAKLEEKKNAEREREWEERVARLKTEMDANEEELDELEQMKLGNGYLRETIDRLRYEMDEMRNTVGGIGVGTGSGSNSNSRAGTISKSLGAELQRKLAEEAEDAERAERERELQARIQRDFPLPPPPDVDTDSSLLPLSSPGDEDNDETQEVNESDDDIAMITTIIKRTRRKVTSSSAQASQTGVSNPEQERKDCEYDENKEYTDRGIQYNIGTDIFFYNHEDDGSQPWPWRGAQTQTDNNSELEPVTPRSLTRREVVCVPVPTAEEGKEERVMASIDVQTEPLDNEDEQGEAFEIPSAPVSSSISNPSGPAPVSVPTDEPPAYSEPLRLRPVSSRTLKFEGAELTKAEAEAETTERQERAEWDVLRKWHHGHGANVNVDIKDLVMAEGCSDFSSLSVFPSKSMNGLKKFISKWWLASNKKSSETLSPDTIEAWARVRRVVGVDCGIVEHLLVSADLDDRDHGPKDGNTVFQYLSFLFTILIYATLSIFIGFALSFLVAGHTSETSCAGYDSYSIYHDRRAWATYHTLAGPGEGFPGIDPVDGGVDRAAGALLKAAEVLIGLWGSDVARSSVMLPT